MTPSKLAPVITAMAVKDDYLYVATGDGLFTIDRYGQLNYVRGLTDFADAKERYERLRAL